MYYPWEIFVFSYVRQDIFDTDPRENYGCVTHTLPASRLPCVYFLPLLSLSQWLWITTVLMSWWMNSSLGHTMLTSRKLIPTPNYQNTTSRNMNAFWYQLKEPSFNAIILVSLVRRIILFKLISCNETYRCTLWHWANFKKIKIKKSVWHRGFSKVCRFSPQPVPYHLPFFSSEILFSSSSERHNCTHTPVQSYYIDKRSVPFSSWLPCLTTYIYLKGWRLYNQRN